MTIINRISEKQVAALLFLFGIFVIIGMSLGAIPQVDIQARGQVFSSIIYSFLAVIFLTGAVSAIRPLIPTIHEEWITKYSSLRVDEKPAEDINVDYIMSRKADFIEIFWSIVIFLFGGLFTGIFSTIYGALGYNPPLWTWTLFLIGVVGFLFLAILYFLSLLRLYFASVNLASSILDSSDILNDPEKKLKLEENLIKIQSFFNIVASENSQASQTALSIDIPNGFYHQYLEVAKKITSKIRMYALGIMTSLYFYILVIALTYSNVSSLLTLVALMSLFLILPYISLENQIHTVLSKAKGVLFISFGKILERTSYSMLNEHVKKDADISNYNDRISSITALRQDIRELPTWTFDTASIGILIFSVIVPILISILAPILSSIIGIG